MFTRIRRLGRESVVYGLSTVLARLLNFFLVPYYTHALSPGQYGVVAAVYSYIAFLNIVFQYGMDQSYMRFVCADRPREKTIFSTAFWPVLLTSAMLAALLWQLRAPLAALGGIGADYGALVTYSGVVLALDALMCVAFAKLRLEHRPLAFAGIRSAGIVVNIAANVVFLTKYQLGPEGVLMASVLSSAVTLALLAPVYAQSLRFEFAGPLFREMWAFAWPFIPAGLAATAVQVIDRPILLFLTDQSTLGIYQAGYRLGIFMMLVVSMFDQAWRPFFLENHEKPGAPELFARVFTYFAVIGAAVVLCVSLFIGDLARFTIFGRHFIAQNYWGGLAVVPVVLAAYLLYGFYINFMAGPMLSKQTRPIVWATAAGAAMNVAANFLLVPFFSLMGAAWATFLSYALMAALMYFYSRKLYPVPYEFGRVARALAAALALWIAHYFTDAVFADSHTLAFAARLMLLTLYFPLLYLNGFFMPSELQKLRTLMKTQPGV